MSSAITDNRREHPQHVRHVRDGRRHHFRNLRYSAGKDHPAEPRDRRSRHRFLAFLDIAFAIDKAFGIKLPLEQWTQEVNEGKAPAEQYFVLENLCKRIDDLVAAKKA